jgi:hypothetical protein
MRERDDEVTALLKRARRRISDPQRWTQGFAAREADGMPVCPQDDDAASWCAVGSLRVEALLAGDVGRAYNRLYAAAGKAPEDVNDDEGHAPVLEMFDEAIRRK